MVILIIVALVILFDIAAYVGGADSRDDTFSPAWKGRQNGFGAGGQY